MRVGILYDWFFGYLEYCLLYSTYLVGIYELINNQFVIMLYLGGILFMGIDGVLGERLQIAVREWVWIGF